MTVVLALLAVAACSPSGGGAGRPEGRTLLGNKGCLSCHPMQGQGGDMAPELGAETAARGEEALFAYLRDPNNVDVYPGNGHAAFPGLSEAQAREIAHFLSGLTISTQYQGPAPSQPR